MFRKRENDFETKSTVNFLRSRMLSRIMIAAMCLGMIAGTGEGAVRQKESASDTGNDPKALRKIIQVYVKDKAGNIVQDLSKEDFEILDQGRKVEISYFMRPSLMKESSGDRNFFLFFDFSYNDSEGIREAVKTSLDFIAGNLDVSDKIAVVSYSPVTKLKIHRFLSNNREDIRKIVEGMKDIKESFGAIESDEVKVQAQLFAENIRDLARGLGMVPGKKNILFFSAGIPNSIFRGVYNKDQRRIEPVRGMIVENVPEADGMLTDKYNQMVRELDAANCAVFPIYPMKEKQDMMAGSSTNMARQFMGDSSLQKLADETGGKFFNTVVGSDVIIKDIQDITGNFYVLGFVPQAGKDGKYSKIKVNVKRDDCEVKTQAGYFAPKPFDKLSDFEKGLHFQDLAFNRSPGVPLEFPFSIQSRSCLYEGETGFVLISRLPAEGMKKVKGKSLEITEIVTDALGNVLLSGGASYDMRKLPQKDTFYVQGRFLSPGRYKANLIIRNLETGASAKSETEVVVPGTANSGISIIQPLLLTPAKGAVFVKGNISKGRDGEAELFNKIFPWLNKNMEPLDPPYRLDPSSIHVFFQCQIREPGISGLTVDLSLKKDADETSIKPRCGLQHVKTGPDMLSFFVDMDLQGVSPGNYAMIVAVKDKGTGRSWNKSVPIEIK